MSESGVFGGGYSDSGGGFSNNDSSSSWSEPTGGVFSGGGDSSSIFPGSTVDVGPSEGGTFGEGYTRHREDHSYLAPAIGAGMVGYFLGRYRTPVPGTAAYQGWQQGYTTAPSYSAYNTAPPGYAVVPSPYSPILPGGAPQYQGSRPAPPLMYYQGPQSDPRRRAKKFLKYASAAACFLGFILYFIVFSSDFVELRDRETHLLSANSWFVESLKISPVGESAHHSRPHPVSFTTTVFAFPSRPSPTKMDQWDLGKRGVLVKGNGFEAWPVWLNRGSTVRMIHDVSDGDMLELVVISGRGQMEDWKTDPTWEVGGGHGIVMERTLMGSGNVSFTASSDALYFFALANLHRSPMVCDFFLIVTSMQYDTSGVERICDLSSPYADPCEVDLPLGAPQFAVLSSSPSSDPTRPKRDIKVSYSPRVVAYVVLLVSPFIAAALLNFLLSRHQDPDSQEGRRAVAAAAVGGGVGGGGAGGGGVGGMSVVGRDEEAQYAVPRVAETAWQAPSVPGAQGDVCCTAPAALPSGKAAIPESWISSTPSEGATEGQADRLIVEPSAPALEEGLSRQGNGGAGGKEDDSCSVCMEAPKDAVILDCGHRAVCFSCGKMLQAGRSPFCPICRQPIKQVAKVYDA